MNRITKVLSYIWELPQNILGLVLSRKSKLRHKVNGRGLYEWNKFEGMSLGHYIFMRHNCISSKLIRHEYGHCIQSQILGWFYLPVVGLSSWIWYHRIDKYLKKHPYGSYYDFCIEKWANKLGKVKLPQIYHL